MTEEQRNIVAAAVAWYRAPRDDLVAAENVLFHAIEVHLRQQEPPREHALAWGRVPAGWEVLAPDGRWYKVTKTRRDPFGFQVVYMVGSEFRRDPKGPVTARGNDPAIEALGFPEVLEDGPC